jgi:hypothetical protein
MACKSVLHKGEVVENKERRFGSSLEYFPCWVIRCDGTQVPALFTAHEIAQAVERGARNLEDVPGRATWLERIFG